MLQYRDNHQDDSNDNPHRNTLLSDSYSNLTMIERMAVIDALILQDTGGLSAFSYTSDRMQDFFDALQMGIDDMPIHAEPITDTSPYTTDSTRQSFLAEYPQLAQLIHASDTIQRTSRGWQLDNCIGFITLKGTICTISFPSGEPCELCGIPASESIVFATIKNAETSRVLAIHALLQQTICTG